LELRSWVDYEFSKWFINLPGVAAMELGGGLEREFQVILAQQRLSSNGFSFQDVADLVKTENQDIAGGRLYSDVHEYSTRTSGRFDEISELKQLSLLDEQNKQVDKAIRLHEVATILDTHADERLQVRLNGQPGVKLSIQKQPTANTVAVVDAINERLQKLKAQNLITDDYQIATVDDSSVFIRHALNNASLAALIGSLLAMLIVFIFLGDWRKTLIIGSSIPIAVLVTFIIMDNFNLTLNIMTLGGLALGIGMLVDNTIVMLENMTRHHMDSNLNPQNNKLTGAMNAAGEITSALVASTSTNLVAVLPFLFIGGLSGLFFKDLIITISAAIVSSLLVALTLVPALAARLNPKPEGGLKKIFSGFFSQIQNAYAALLSWLIRFPILVIFIATIALVFSLQDVLKQKQIFLPNIDEGRVRISIRGEPGLKLQEMKNIVHRIEQLLLADPLVETAFSTIGGSIFGRSQYESSNRSSIKVQLRSRAAQNLIAHNLTSKEWISNTRKKFKQLNLPGIKIRMWVKGIRGVRFGSSEDDIEVKIVGKDIDKLAYLGTQFIDQIDNTPALKKQLKNLAHSYDEYHQQLNIKINRERASDLSVDTADIAYAIKVALGGVKISDFIDGDRSYDIRMRLPKKQITEISSLRDVLIKNVQGNPVYLRDVANVVINSAPSSIERENQQRVNEISASLHDAEQMQPVLQQLQQQIDAFKLSAGYAIYLGGSDKILREGQRLSRYLLALAIFLVFVVMAVQYESLRNPLVILCSIPFTLTGVAIGIQYLNIPLSMPVWLGLIMLTGIVVNNAIVLVEQIENTRKKQVDQTIIKSIIMAAKLRLRPILMTTLTTVFGMLPLSLGLGEGAEMLRPLAIVIVCGLSYSIMVSLFLIPIIYALFTRVKT